MDRKKLDKAEKLVRDSWKPDPVLQVEKCKIPNCEYGGDAIIERCPIEKLDRSQGWLDPMKVIDKLNEVIDYLRGRK